LHFYLQLMDDMRSAIETGAFSVFRQRFANERARGC
jgi:queuine tRNA-ribosyltransferase